MTFRRGRSNSTGYLATFKIYLHNDHITAASTDTEFNTEFAGFVPTVDGMRIINKTMLEVPIFKKTIIYHIVE